MPTTDPKKRRKIVLGITKSNFGGAQRYVHDLAHALHIHGHDVTVLCGGSGILVEKLRAAKIRVVTVPALTRDITFFGDIAAFFALLRILRAERPDVFHINSAKMGGLGALAARIAGVPRIIFTAHGWAFNEPRSRLVRAIIYVVSRITVSLAHRTIAVSESIARDIGGGSDIIVIKHGIPPFRLVDRLSARQTLMKLDPSLSEGLWIATVAELHTVKGIDVGIAGCESLLRQSPYAHYLVLGEGDARSRLEEDIRRRGLENRVHLLGYVDDAASLMLAFDIFLLPSRSEALGYVLLEAGTAGLPVVASNIGGIPEIIEQQETGILVTPGDTEELQTAVTELAGNPEKRRELGEALQRHVNQSFSFDTAFKETLRVYD